MALAMTGIDNMDDSTLIDPQAPSKNRPSPASARRGNGGGDPSPWLPAAFSNAKAEADVVSLPRRRCLSIDVRDVRDVLDAPDVPDLDRVSADALRVLYGTAYALKFARKRAGKALFMVRPLEVVSRLAAPRDSTSQTSPEGDGRRYRIALPNDVTTADLEAVKQELVTRKGGKLEGNTVLGGVFLEVVPAERAGRVLHVGPPQEEAASLERIGVALASAALAARPEHIKIYLKDSDPAGFARARTIVLLRPTTAPPTLP